MFIPRPETERLVEEAVGLLAPPDRRLLAPVAVEIGCGTGIIGISLALEVPRLTVYATDVNPAAVELTEHNAHTLGADPRVHLLPGQPLRSAAGPPEGTGRSGGQQPALHPRGGYSRPGRPRWRSTIPHEALDGGEDGLVFYRALASTVGSLAAAGRPCGRGDRRRPGPGGGGHLRRLAGARTSGSSGITPTGTGSSPPAGGQHGG